jgi:hypothetical protein
MLGSRKIDERQRRQTEVESDADKRHQVTCYAKLVEIASNRQENNSGISTLFR